MRYKSSRNYYNKIIIYILFLSYFIFLLTTCIGIFQYRDSNNLNFLEQKFAEIEDKYNYLVNNMYVGDIEDNNREILYLEEMKSEIFENVDREGSFWMVDLKNLIDQKEENLLKKFSDQEDVSYSSEYLKLKNEIDEYNLYYTLKKKPVDYLDGIFMKYFLFLFNSKGHQIFLTFIVLSICYLLIQDGEYIGFFKTLIVSCFPVLGIQIFFLVALLAIDTKVDIFYPIRIIENFRFENIIDFNNLINDKTLPLYTVIFNVLLLEFLYMIFIIAFIKIIDLVFTQYYLKFAGAIVFLLSMIGMVYTRYSSISVFSYGRFLDIIRGYQALYKNDMYLNIKFFSVFILGILIILNVIYLIKKYIINDKYII